MMTAAGCNLQKYLLLLLVCRSLKKLLLESQNPALNSAVWLGIFYNSELFEMLDLITEESPLEVSCLHLCITDDA